ncbi:phosphoglucosamine mutase [soil metagenome]
MAERLFGTDGVRGVAGDVLPAELALSLGRAAAAACEAERPQILIVRDTRGSGPMLEAGLAAGISQAGGEALFGGVLPTPAASILTRRHGLDMAAVVSASHNPWRDNGIKFFASDGGKLSDELQSAIEREVLATDARTGAIGRTRELRGALDDYLRELETGFPVDLTGLKVVLDCANGATYRAAPEIFQRLGATVETIAAEPDGRNINEGCGSTHPEALAERVRESDASIGFAFDGDGDRLIAVDADGTVRDGDELIALTALHLRENANLKGVVVTVMSNYGFHSAMEEAGVEVEITPVGDRHVAVALAERGWSLGGEQSGHLIWTDFAPTGDGIAAALLVTQALGGRTLAEAVPMRKLPQMLRNVVVAEREAIAGSKALWEAVEKEGEALSGRGRVLVRPSGTEPLVRVMVEAPEAEECEAVCSRLVDVVQHELG